MTIAIGMRYDFGVLLCADSQFSTNSLKTNDLKVDSFQCPNGGTVAYAMAGNAPFAKSAMQKSKTKLLKNVDGKPVAEVLEEELETQYNRHILKNPSQAQDYNLQYWFLLAVWEPSVGLKFYATSQTSMSEVEGGLECIGIGQDLAQYIIKPSYYPRMTEREVSILSAYALARAKEFVPYCGGPSQVLLMSNQDGKVKRPKPDTVALQERRLVDCDRQMRALLLRATNVGIEEMEFESSLASFGGSVRILRRECQAEKEFQDRVRYEARLAGAPGNDG